jgi:hypothetical protein
MKNIPFYCKYCGKTEEIPNVQDGISIEDVTKVTCMDCLSKGKRSKMYKIVKECGK